MISVHQHGFVRNRSTHSNLLNFYFKVFKRIDCGNAVDVITIDMNKAFDQVNHSILLEKLKNSAISSKFLNLLNSFLSNRKQMVCYEGHLSDLSEVPSGVPQGSVLSPLLFAVYINDLLNKPFANSIVCYADDIKLWGPPSESLNSDLRIISEWMDANYMSVNSDKLRNYSPGKEQPPENIFIQKLNDKSSAGISRSGHKGGQLFNLSLPCSLYIA